MPQLIFYIFVFILSIVLEAADRRNVVLGTGHRIGLNTEIDPINWVINYNEKRNSRINALRHAKEHLKPYEKLFGNHTLSNKHCSLQLIAKEKKVVCLSKEYDEKGNKMMVVGSYFKEITVDDYFDTICRVFNYNTKYENILNSLNDVASKSVSIYMHKEVKETPQPPKYDEKGEYIPQKEDIVEIQIKSRENLDIVDKIDINNASESELTALPGINVIMAKKIIAYRDQQRAFKSVDDFIKEMKIKPHFEKQLRDLICVNKVNIKKYKKAKAERIIDL